MTNAFTIPKQSIFLRENRTEMLKSVAGQRGGVKGRNKVDPVPARLKSKGGKK